MTIWQLIMTIDGKIRYENLQCNIKRGDALLALSSGKIDKYEYNWIQIIEQAKFNILL